MRFLECRKWGFKRWGFKQIWGHLRKKAFFLRYPQFPRSSSHPPEKRKKVEKGRKKADFGRFPGRAARYPLNPHLLHPHLRQPKKPLFTRVVLAMCPDSDSGCPGTSKIVAFFCWGSTAGKDSFEETSAKTTLLKTALSQTPETLWNKTLAYENYSAIFKMTNFTRNSLKTSICPRDVEAFSESYLHNVISCQRVIMFSHFGIPHEGL